MIKTLKDFLPKSNELPIIKKDENHVDQFIALQTIGMFATKESAREARADRPNAILREKERDHNELIEKHMAVMDEIKRVGIRRI